MNHPDHYSHPAIYSQLATDYSLSPEDIAVAERVFGNDFTSLELSLSDPDPLSFEELS